MSSPFRHLAFALPLLLAPLAAQGPGEKSTAPLAMSNGAPDPGTPLGAAWQRFLQGQREGTWWSRWSPATGTPKEIYGSGLPIADWRGGTIEEARRHATRLLSDHGDLLGLGDCEFREVIGARMGQTWAFVYDQYYRGLQVIGGRADVRVHAVGRIPMFGSTAWQIPQGFSTVPAISELEAVRVAWQRVGIEHSDAAQPGAARNPRLVIWGDVLAPAPAPVRLAWEIPISNVDALNGAVLHYVSDKHECGGHDHGADTGHDEPKKAGAAAPPIAATGRVMAWTRTGLAANSPLVNVPVAGATILTTQGNVQTDANGYYSVNLNPLVPYAGATFTLGGVHCLPVTGINSPIFTATIYAGNNGIAQMFAPTELEAAHTTAYHWVYEVNEFCRSVLGNSPQLAAADNIHPYVNVAQTCNGYYTANTINFYQSGGGCNNSAFSTFVDHEWGHGLDDRYGGTSNNNGDGLSEGWGDIIAMYHVDDPIIFANFYTNGGYARTGNNATVYPPPTEVHAAGEVWMGFAWQLRERLATTLGNRSSAIAITNDIVLGTIVANAQNQLSAYLQVYIADDNDGNLANLTPHATEIAWAGAVKHYPYPLAGAPSNDECAGAWVVHNGTNGPFSNDAAFNSPPAWSCTGFGSKDVWFKYLAGAGPLTVSTCGQAAFDTVIEVFAGDCGALTSVGCNDDNCSLQSSVTINVATPGWRYIRVGGYNAHSGTFNLAVNGTPAPSASWSPYGAGCYSYSRAFYELTPAAAFDLNQTAMRLLRLGSNIYSVSAVGAYHVPSAAATVLALGDDDEVAVPLSGVFYYPGGSTSSLVVCSNGFVSPATGNGTGYQPGGPAWVTSQRPCWGTWHDFNPSATGSGRVKFEQVGSVAYVTWDGVYDFGTTSPSTWQLQFDLAASSVTAVWQTMSGLGGPILVGYTPGGVNPDEGSRDISATMPFPTRLSNTFPLTLAAAPPTFGSTVPLTVTGFPSGAAFGAVLLGFVQQSPGIDLVVYGMPGCYAHIGAPYVTALVLPGGGTATYNQPIPSDTTYLGLQLVAQAFAHAPGANATGMIASNGVGLAIGF